MARRYQRLHRRRRPQNRRYVVPAVLIVLLFTAIIWGIFGRDGDKSEDPNSPTDNKNMVNNVNST